MEKLFYKYPSTIGEELKYQVQYCKSIGKFKNNSDISLQMRNLEKEVFGEERKYISKDEINKYEVIRNVRPATLTELFKISLDKKISNYFLLFTAFKALSIIKEDHNIIQLLDYYGIIPKKKNDKERLDELRSKYNLIKKENCIKFCIVCNSNNKSKCRNFDKCLYIEIKRKIENLSVDEQIKYLYALGLPSNFEKIKTFPDSGDYRLKISSLKVILKELGEKEKLEFINKLESKYNKELEKKNIKIKAKEIKHDEELKIIKNKLENIKSQESKDVSLIHKEQVLQERYDRNKRGKQNRKRLNDDRRKKVFQEMLFIISKKCILNQPVNNENETFEDFL